MPRGSPRRRLGSLARRDLPASFVVFLVAVPLSLGIAVATGAPVAAGLVAAIVGGIVVGALGGSKLQVTVVVEGRLSFLSLPRLSRLLAQVPPRSAVELKLVTDFLDHAAFEHLDAWIRQHESGGGTVTATRRRCCDPATASFPS